MSLGEGGSSQGYLSQGSKGEEVRKLQEQLKAAGFDPGPIDADFGPQTAAALKGFQQGRGLEADAILGPLTRNALSPAPALTTPITAGKQALGGTAADFAALAKGVTYPVAIGGGPAPGAGQVLGGTTADFEKLQKAAGVTPWTPTVPAPAQAGANLQYREPDLVAKLNAVAAGGPVDNAATEAAEAQRVKDEAAAALKKKQDAIAAAGGTGGPEAGVGVGAGDQAARDEAARLAALAKAAKDAADAAAKATADKAAADKLVTGGGGTTTVTPPGTADLFKLGTGAQFTPPAVTTSNITTPTFTPPGATPPVPTQQVSPERQALLDQLNRIQTSNNPQATYSPFTYQAPAALTYEEAQRRAAGQLNP
jgi:peptidoglycan hydrolase-like protein with peptidoglycan-binding domain